MISNLETRAGLSWWEAWGPLGWEVPFPTPIAYTTNYSLYINYSLYTNYIIKLKCIVLIGGKPPLGGWPGAQAPGPHPLLIRPCLKLCRIFNPVLFSKVHVHFATGIIKKENGKRTTAVV